MVKRETRRPQDAVPKGVQVRILPGVLHPAAKYDTLQRWINFVIGAEDPSREIKQSVVRAEAGRCALGSDLR